MEKKQLQTNQLHHNVLEIASFDEVNCFETASEIRLGIIDAAQDAKEESRRRKIFAPATVEEQILLEASQK